MTVSRQLDGDPSAWPPTLLHDHFLEKNLTRRRGRPAPQTKLVARFDAWWQAHLDAHAGHVVTKRRETHERKGARDRSHLCDLPAELFGVGVNSYLATRAPQLSPPAIAVLRGKGGRDRVNSRDSKV